MRAIFRTLNIPLGIIFTWIKRYGKKMLLELKRKWEEAKKDNKSTVRVVDEMWTYLRRRAKAFRKWVFTIFDYTRRGLYVTFAFGDRDEKTFKEAEKYTAPGRRWVSNNYNVYLSLRDHVVVSPVNPNESFHSSLRDRLARFKRPTKAVNRSAETVECSLTLVLYERGLIPEFIL